MNIFAIICICVYNICRREYHPIIYRSIAPLSCYLVSLCGAQAAAVVESKLKMSDIHCALTICSLMYQRYADFSSSLMENWHKALLTKKDDKVEKNMVLHNFFKEK